MSRPQLGPAPRRGVGDDLAIKEWVLRLGKSRTAAHHPLRTLHVRAAELRDSCAGMRGQGGDQGERHAATQAEQCVRVLQYLQPTASRLRSSPARDKGNLPFPEVKSAILASKSPVIPTNVC